MTCLLKPKQENLPDKKLFWDYRFNIYISLHYSLVRKKIKSIYASYTLAQRHLRRFSFLAHFSHRAWGPITILTTGSVSGSTAHLRSRHFGPVPQWLSRCLQSWDCLAHETHPLGEILLHSQFKMKNHPLQIIELSDSEAGAFREPVLNIPRSKVFIFPTISFSEVPGRTTSI